MNKKNTIIRILKEWKNNPNKLKKDFFGVNDIQKKELGYNRIYNDEEILSYFEERYGTEILASPPGQGFNRFVWITPIVFIVAAFIIFSGWLKYSVKEKVS